MQQHNNPILLDNQNIAHQKLDYLHNNPVIAGFVEKPEDWLYSSAKEYYTGKKGLINILFIDPMLITVK
jgi:putative transposase